MDKRIYRIYGLEKHIVPTHAQALSFYTPEARPIIQNAIKAAMLSGIPWDLELPIVNANFIPIWVRSRGSAVWENNKIVRLKGAFQDITERKKMK